MKYKDEDPDNLGGLGGMLPAEVLKLINELLEQQHRAGHNNHGSKIEIVIVQSGGQHVETQINVEALPHSLPKGRGETPTAETSFNDSTPLSALFRENHHEKLRKVIDSWRPYLIDDNPDIDTVAISNFQFDMTAIRPVSIYMDLAYLINHDALRPPMSVLAAYMFQHSNLSRSKNALYVQLKRYRKMCE